MKRILIMDSGSFMVFGGAARTSYDTYNYFKKFKDYKVDAFVDFSKIDKGLKPISEEQIGSGYDVILMNSIRDVPLVMKYVDLKRGKTKFIYTDRGNVLLNFNKASFKKFLPKMMVRQYLALRMRKWLTCYVALSAEQYAYAKDFFFNRTMVKYIPNWHVAKFRRLSNAKKKGYALSVGRLDERQKKVKFLIDGIGRVKELHRDLDDRELLRIVGEGPDEESYRRYVKDWGIEENISFHGFVRESELLRSYNSAQFFVSTSEWEGMSGAFIEAMACGLPLLINNRNNTVIGYNPKRALVTNNYNGLVYDYDDVDDFAERFYQLYSSQELCNRLGKNAHLLSKSFEMHRNLEKYRRLVELL